MVKEKNYHMMSLLFTVIPWITLCHKNLTTMFVITFWQVHATSLTMTVSTMHFLFEIMFISMVKTTHFKGAYDI